jgi:hypothetical protein
MNDLHESERPPWKTYGEVSHPTVGRRISGRSGGPTEYLHARASTSPGVAEAFKLVNTVQHSVGLPQQTKIGMRTKKPRVSEGEQYNSEAGPKRKRRTSRHCNQKNSSLHLKNHTPSKLNA